MGIAFSHDNGFFSSSGSVSSDNSCWLTLTESEMKPASLVLPSNYIVANVQQYGFYRVNYDVRNWDRIINALYAASPLVSIVVNTCSII